LSIRSNPASAQTHAPLISSSLCFAPAKVPLFKSLGRDHASLMTTSEIANAHRDDPDDQARARIAEIGEILALGLVRLHARQSSRMLSGSGESWLEPVGHQSGHANSETEKA
jgi:hypothetical protein